MSAERPHLLFLCQTLPFPPDGGVLIRSFHTLRLLARRFEVTALCFYRAKTRSDPDAVHLALRHLSAYAAVEAFPIPQESSRFRFGMDHMRSMLTGRAYTRWVYESREFRDRLETCLSGQRFDLAHVDSLDLVTYLPALREMPVVLAHHNVESQLLSRRGDAIGGGRGAYLRCQAKFTKREEQRWCPRVAFNAVVSLRDKTTLTLIAPSGRYVVVPNGVDTKELKPAPPGPRKGIVFVGGATWFPNLDGMRYFVTDILPLIRSYLPDTRVTWVGRVPNSVKHEFATRGVTTTGYVEDIRPYVAEAACFVVPLRVGGGTRLKILDAWALGKAVVSTSVGSEGLATRDGENIIVTDDAGAFSRAVVRALTDSQFRRQLETEGRATAVECYDWEVVGRGMLQEYEEILAS